MAASSPLDFVAHILQSPALMPRDGPKKPWKGFNYTQQDEELHTAERASIPATYTIATIFPVLAIVFVGLRFVSASRSKAGRTADDWIILAALFPTIASCVWVIATYVIDKDRIVKSFFKEAEKGDFTELDDPLGNANALQWGPGVVTTLYLTALTLTKLSILLLYRRLFDTKVMHRIVQGGVVFIGLTWITFVVPSLLGLANVPALSNGTVFDFILVFGCIDLFTDIVLLALPIPFIWSLQMSNSRKAQILGMFSLGAFCVVSSTVRLAFLIDYWVKLQFIFSHELDWYATFTIASFAKSWWMTWIWGLIEPCTSIIAACLPTLRPLVDGCSDHIPWLARMLSSVYPSRSINSRSAGSHSLMDPNSSVSSADSVELEKLRNQYRSKLVVTEQVLSTREGRSVGDRNCVQRSHIESKRQEWSRDVTSITTNHTRRMWNDYGQPSSAPSGLRQPGATAARPSRSPNSLHPEQRTFDMV